MTIGYSWSMVERIRGADHSSPGVRLGAKCIEKGIPVTEVAKACGVTRQTIYNWFVGRWEPKREKDLAAIARLLDVLG